MLNKTIKYLESRLDEFQHCNKISGFAFFAFINPDESVRAVPLIVSMPKSIAKLEVLEQVQDCIIQVQNQGSTYLHGLVSMITSGRKFDILPNITVNDTSAHWHMQMKYLIRGGVVPKELGEQLLKEDALRRGTPSKIIMENIAKNCPNLNAIDREYQNTIGYYSGNKPARANRDTADTRELRNLARNMRKR